MYHITFLAALKIWTRKLSNEDLQKSADGLQIICRRSADDLRMGLIVPEPWSFAPSFEHL
jgi:hypothetical protein